VTAGAPGETDGLSGGSGFNWAMGLGAAAETLGATV